MHPQKVKSRLLYFYMEVLRDIFGSQTRRMLEFHKGLTAGGLRLLYAFISPPHWGFSPNPGFIEALRTY